MQSMWHVRIPPRAHQDEICKLAVTGSDLGCLAVGAIGWNGPQRLPNLPCVRFNRLSLASVPI